jgi:hypothetical protein
MAWSGTSFSRLHCPACPGHLFRHVRRQAARTGPTGFRHRGALIGMGAWSSASEPASKQAMTLSARSSRSSRRTKNGASRDPILGTVRHETGVETRFLGRDAHVSVVGRSPCCALAGEHGTARARRDACMWQGHAGAWRRGEGLPPFQPFPDAHGAKRRVAFSLDSVRRDHRGQITRSGSGWRIAGQQVVGTSIERIGGDGGRSALCWREVGEAGGVFRREPCCSGTP